MQATKESAIAVLEIQADSAPLQRFVSQKHCSPLIPLASAGWHPVTPFAGRQPMSIVAIEPVGVLLSVVDREHFSPAEQVSLMQSLVSTDFDPWAMQGFVAEPQHCSAAEAPMALMTTSMAMMTRDRIFVFLWNPRITLDCFPNSIF